MKTLQEKEITKQKDLLKSAWIEYAKALKDDNYEEKYFNDPSEYDHFDALKTEFRTRKEILVSLNLVTNQELMEMKKEVESQLDVHFLIVE